MRTQSNVDSETRPLSATEPGADTMSFRGNSLDEAVALAEESLGSPVRVVSASRIRRGGIGGFFASDLGVEVSVALDDETIEQALERLVSETAADERSRWLEHRVADAPAARTTQKLASTAQPPTAPAPATSVAGISALAAPRRNALSTPKSVEAPRMADALKIPDAVARIAQRDAEPSMVRVEEIIEELQILTRPLSRTAADGSAEVFAPPVPPAPRTVALPRLPPRPVDIARAAAANAAASHAQALAVQQDRARDTASLEARRLETAETKPEATVEIDLDVAAAPSQRQVELAVAATDQLIESLQRDGVKRLSVRVVLRTGDQSAVEAEAQWEAS